MLAVGSRISVNGFAQWQVLRLASASWSSSWSPRTLLVSSFVQSSFSSRCSYVKHLHATDVFGDRALDSMLEMQPDVDLPEDLSQLTQWCEYLLKRTELSPDPRAQLQVIRNQNAQVLLNMWRLKFVNDACLVTHRIFMCQLIFTTSYVHDLAFDNVEAHEPD